MEKKIGKLRISIVKNDSFINPKYAKANIGESIQSVAMQLIYDLCGVVEEDIVRINQCDVKKYQNKEIILPLRLPLSSDNIDEFLPLDKCVHPFFISLHLHDDVFVGRPDLVEYFKKYEPIGCRDEMSCDFFRRHDIESYIMGCYTLVFSCRGEGEYERVFVVDASEELKENIPKQLLNEAVFMSHAVPYWEYPITVEEDQRLENLAKKRLKDYRENGSLVITSRIHVAAPCVAMGVPVILATDNADFRYAWIDKFIPLHIVKCFLQ